MPFTMTVPADWQSSPGTSAAGQGRMGWVIGVIAVFVVVGLLALAVPPVFGVALAGLTPLLVVLLLIGLGGVWWRAQHRVDAKPKADQPGADAEDERR